MNENIIKHGTSTKVFKMKLMQRSDETTAFSTNLKTAIDSDNNLKILSKVNQDERTRLPELREKSETRIVNENNKLICSSQTISYLKEDSKYITTSKGKKRHDESKRLKESRKISKTIADDKEKKISRMTENIIDHATSNEAFQMNLLKRSDETTKFSKKLMTESDSGNQLKIMSKVNQDEKTRLPEIGKKLEIMIVTDNNKLICSSQKWYKYCMPATALEPE